MPPQSLVTAGMQAVARTHLLSMVCGLTYVAAVESGDSDIRVNAVAPGYIDTPMLDLSIDGNKIFLEQGLSLLPIKRKVDAVEVAKVIAFLLFDESSFVTGAIHSVNGGWNV